MKRILSVLLVVLLLAGSVMAQGLVRICEDSGMYATRNCPHVVIMKYQPGQSRIQLMCPLHPDNGPKGIIELVRKALDKALSLIWPGK